MKRILLGIPLLCVAVLTSGCFQTERTVRLKPDGSGNVEEMVLLSTMMQGLMDQAAGGAAEAGGAAVAEGADSAAAGDAAREEKPAAPVAKQKKELFSEEEGQKRAAAMGDGVTFVRVIPEKREGFEGYRAIYAFKDINKLRLGSDPEMPGNEAGDKKGGEYAFTFSKGKGKQLVLVLHSSNPAVAKTGEEPKPEPAAKAEPATAEPEAPMDENSAQMAKMLFNGMRFADRLVIEGEIVESNASFRNGSEITLLDVDFTKVLDSPKELTRLQQAKDDAQQAKEIMKKIPGFKVDMNEELKVVFAPKGK